MPRARGKSTPTRVLPTRKAATRAIKEREAANVIGQDVLQHNDQGEQLIDLKLYLGPKI